MNTEKMIAKGVEKHFDGQRVLFKVESLNEHFKGLVIHESDWVKVEDEAYVVLSDVNFDNATDNEIQRKSEVIEEDPYELSEEGTVGIVSTLSPEESDALIKGMNDDFPTNEIDIVVTQETLDMNPELVAEGITVGETITIDATEDFPVWVNAETEVIEPEVVEPEIVAPEVIVAETPNEETETEKE